MYIFKKKIAYLLGLGLSLIFFSFFAYADDDNENESGVSVEAALFYHNKYIDEGMNEIPGSGIFTPEFVAEFEDVRIGDIKIPDFYIGGWWAIGESENFTETNLFIGKVLEWEDFSLGFSYTWIHEDEDEDEAEGEAEGGAEGEEESNEDHEFEVALECDCLPWGFASGAAYVYSTEMDGGAFEVELGKEIEMEYFSIEPYVEALVDFGYVNDEYDGLSHIELGIEVSIPLNDVVSLEMYGAHSFAEENIRRVGGEDQTWGGIGLEFEM